MVPIPYIALDRVTRFTLGVGTVFTLGGRTDFTFGGVVGVFQFPDFSFPTLGPTIPVVRIFPILCRQLSMSVPGVPGGKEGPAAWGCCTVSLISLRRRFIRSIADVSGSSQHVGKNSRVFEMRLLFFPGM